MAVRYQIRSKNAEKWSKPFRLIGATLKVRNRLSSRPAPYHGYEKNAPWATRFRRWKLWKAIQKLRDKLKAAHTGEVWRLESKPTGFYVAVKKVEIGPKLADPPSIGTPPLKRWHQEIFGLIPGLVSWGIYNCRPPSQHSYSNAEDVHGTPAQMQQVWDYTIANADRLEVRNVIYNRRIWTKGIGERAYTGVSPHTDHDHVDFEPKLAGDCRVVG